MKKLIFLFILSPFFLLAQQPFGKNATWFVSYYDFGFTGYKEISYQKDTTLLNQTWQKFSVTGLKQIKTGPNVEDLIQVPNAKFAPLFLRTNNDSVFSFLDSTVILLYDFSAQVGDSWNFAPRDTAFSCSDSSVATVVEIGYDTIQGVPLKYWLVEDNMDTLNINGNPVYGCSSGWCLGGKIYQLIGQTSLSKNAQLPYIDLFTPYYNYCEFIIIRSPDYSNNLRCFNNDTISLSFYNKDCNYWSLIGIDEYQKIPFTVYPNPSSGFINIESLQEIEKVTVLDLTGRPLSETYQLTDIELPHNNGLYLISVTFKSGQTTTQKVEVQRL